MFEIGFGWMEMAVIALMVLLVIGPKDLPKVLRSMAHWMRKIRGLASEFQSGLDDMVREADLEDERNALKSTKNMNVNKILEDVVDPTGEVSEEARNIQKTAQERTTVAEPAAKPQKDVPETAEAAAETAEESKAPGESDEAEANVIHHPAQVAPPHSLTPAKEPEAEPAATADDGKQKSA